MSQAINIQKWMTLFLHAFQTFVNEMFADVEILLCASQMWSSLSRLSSLPDDTRVFCGHEYTVVKCKSASLCRLHAFRTRFLFRLPDNALEFQTGLPCFLYSTGMLLCKVHRWDHWTYWAKSCSASSVVPHWRIYLFSTLPGQCEICSDSGAKECGLTVPQGGCRATPTERPTNSKFWQSQLLYSIVFCAQSTGFQPKKKVWELMNEFLASLGVDEWVFGAKLSHINRHSVTCEVHTFTLGSFH